VLRNGGRLLSLGLVRLSPVTCISRPSPCRKTRESNSTRYRQLPPAIGLHENPPYCPFLGRWYRDSSVSRGPRLTNRGNNEEIFGYPWHVHCIHQERIRKKLSISQGIFALCSTNTLSRTYIYTDTNLSFTLGSLIRARSPTLYTP
jgi:hypothetical protein